jgi:hypothetical protein
LISLKPFVWPLGLWLIATRRYAAAGYALVTGVVINAVAWGLVGFDQLHRYDRVVQTVTNVMYKRGYDIVAFAMKLGAVHIVAYLCGLALAGVAGLACLYYGRRANDRSALTLAIALSLLATPVLWTHYFALAIIPLALARPRLSGAWFLPLLMAVCPVNPAAWQLAVALALIGTVFAITLRRGDPSAEPVEPTSVVHHVGSKPPRIAAFAAR